MVEVEEEAEEPTERCSSVRGGGGDLRGVMGVQFWQSGKCTIFFGRWWMGMGIGMGMGKTRRMRMVRMGMKTCK